MTEDRQYRDIDFAPSEVAHEYGEGIHIQEDPLALTRLARLCSPEIGQPAFNRLIGELYRQLLWNVVAAEFPRTDASIPSRMQTSTGRGVYRGTVIDPETRVVTVDVARAGMVPSEVCYRRLNQIVNEEGVRQDHLFMSRRTDEQGRVIGAELLGDKVGGPVEGGFVLFPDPMGATGSSMSQAVDFYNERVGGAADQMIAMNLIVTPEFVERMQQDHPDVKCYAMRLDRGTSPSEILETIPGERWDAESGLDDNDYIVPGGGGFGELMNNSWV